MTIRKNTAWCRGRGIILALIAFVSFTFTACNGTPTQNTPAPGGGTGTTVNWLTVGSLIIDPTTTPKVNTLMKFTVLLTATTDIRPHVDVAFVITDPKGSKYTEPISSDFLSAILNTPTGLFVSGYKVEPTGGYTVTATITQTKSDGTTKVDVLAGTFTGVP